MKTENTLENKARFSALYIYQKVFWHEEYKKEVAVLDAIRLDIGYRYIAEAGYKLLLTPLSQITDEDASKIAWLCNTGIGFAFEYKAIKSGLQLSKLPNIPQPAVDYLRSKGYALPWLDLSVEDLVAYEWIKLEVL